MITDLTWRGYYIYSSATIDGMIAQCDFSSPEEGVITKSVGPFGVFTSKPIPTPRPRAPPSETKELFRELRGTQLRNQARDLFHHYINCTAINMMPFQDIRNPWLSCYPSMARSGSALGQKSLLYAIIAQAAGNLAHLGYRREEMLVLARMFYATAIKQLREGLEENSADFSVIMASILTLVMAEVQHISIYSRPCLVLRC